MKLLGKFRPERIPPPYRRVRGIYFLCRRKLVVYVGESAHLFRRVYSGHSCISRRSWTHAFWIATPRLSRSSRISIERFFIHNLKPRFNEMNANVYSARDYNVKSELWVMKKLKISPDERSRIT